MMKNIILFVLIVFFVSQAAISQTENYEVYAIRFASTAHAFAISNWADKGPDKDSLTIDFMIWLIKGKNGKNILVDAGFLNDLEQAHEFGIKNYIRPDSTLSKLSLKAEDITDIILSHPHWDHIDGIDLFPNAHIWMQKEDFNYFVGTAWQKDGNHGGFAKRDVQKLIGLNMAGRLILVDGDDKEIIPGIKVYTGSRHTFNSQYAVVETGINKIVLASDNIWIYYNLEQLRPAPSYGTFDAAAYVKSMQRMKTLASNIKFIIPGHDSKVFSIFPVISEGVVQVK
jgi:glyoxylase-like metal-dependent hydrolase (beta-lactamase superfamily II)